MRKIDAVPEPISCNLKIRKDNIYCEGRIIARYDIDPSKGGYSMSDMISIFSKSGMLIALAFAPLFEPTCRILTEADQREHFIQADPERKYMRVQQVVEFLIRTKYLHY